MFLIVMALAAMLLVLRSCSDSDGSDSDLEGDEEKLLAKNFEDVEFSDTAGTSTSGVCVCVCVPRAIWLPCLCPCALFLLGLGVDAHPLPPLVNRPCLVPL